MGAKFEEIPGAKSESGGKVYTIEEVDLPTRVAEYCDFADQFNGYEHFPEHLGEIANGVCQSWYEHHGLPDDLKLLRSCLFYEFRRARFVWGFPSESDLPYLDALVTKIKTLLGNV